MIYKIAPKYGRKNPLIYLSICSTTGSVSIMAIKAFGTALKMTFNGDNQFSHPSTYVFVIMIVGCIMTQMNYFNKALSQFSTNMYGRILLRSGGKAANILLALIRYITSHSPLALSSHRSSFSRASTLHLPLTLFRSCAVFSSYSRAYIS